MNINKTKIIVFMIYFVSVMALVVLFSNSYHNLKKTDSEIEKLDNVINELFHLENIDAHIWLACISGCQFVCSCSCFLASLRGLITFT